MEGELKKIYSGQKPTSLLDLFRRKEATVKLELSDYVDEVESKPFENVDLDTKESLHDDFSAHEDSYQDEDELNEEDASFVKYANKVFIHTDTRDHLPVPVYNYTKPSLGAQFILHLLLSMVFSRLIKINIMKSEQSSII